MLHNHQQGYKPTRFMDGSVTYANLKDATDLWVANFATHCSVLVQWSLAKQHLLNQVEGSPPSFTEGKVRTKRKGWTSARSAQLQFLFVQIGRTTNLRGACLSEVSKPEQSQEAPKKR